MESNMKIEYYRNTKTDEIIYKEEAKEYVLNRLGLTVTPKGENGTMTLEQIENIESTVEWFFSGDWVLEEIEGIEEPSVFELIKEGCELENV